jgi:hypothetical protein
MLVLVPSDPFEPSCPDEAWLGEIQEAERAKHKVAYVHWEGIVNDNDAPYAVRHVRKRERPTLGLYRGWMLTVEDYTKVHAALVERNVWLINDPRQYATCHLFVDWYKVAEGFTPRSAWVEGIDLDGAVKLVRETIGGPAIVRDFVKSRKHEWNDACFIESPEDAARVIRNFVERQGESLVGGIVVREFVKLRHLGRHPKSGTPLSLEYRSFWLDGEPLLTLPYWAEATYDPQLVPPLERFRPVVAKIDSRLFSMDLAMTEEGEWIIVEIGDGQVSGIPIESAREFYANLAERAR